MKRAAILFAVICLMNVLPAFAAPERGMQSRGGGGWGMSSQYGRMYDPKTVETISGVVERIDEFSPIKGMSNGVHLTVKTETGPVSVHLGPAWYLRNQDILIKPNDKVEVTGSRITFNGKPAIIAKEVKKGNEILSLRDDNGYPVWSGWRRG